jgi:hypothetical protein
MLQEYDLITEILSKESTVEVQKYCIFNKGTKLSIWMGEWYIQSPFYLNIHK